MNKISYYTRQVGKEFQQFKSIIEEFCANEENGQTATLNTHRAIIYMFNKKALDQHDTEVRNKVIDEVLELVKENAFNDIEMWFRSKIIYEDDLIPKLDEMKVKIKEVSNDSLGD